MHELEAVLHAARESQRRWQDRALQVPACRLLHPGPLSIAQERCTLNLPKCFYWSPLLCKRRQSAAFASFKP